MTEIPEMEDESSYRSFCDVLESQPAPAEPMITNSTSAALDQFRAGLVGRFEQFHTPFGEKPLVYADWTASGRAHKAVEQFVGEQVLTQYGNTHTTTSITGHQSTCFRHEARQIVAESLNAKITGRAAEDVVLFTGAGTTAAVMKLIQLLGLHTPLPVDAPESQRPVVLVGPHEHHSNLLPWRESCALVLTVREDPETKQLDHAHLVELLSEHDSSSLKIGSFAAASNITGIMEDVDEVSRIVHRHGGFAFWDYATAASYTKMDMNPLSSSLDGASSARLACRDAMFFSPHKFAGGVNTPGVLVVKKRLLANRVPTAPGGGTVFYVTDHSHRYLSNREEREEGGTPDLVGTIRVGLALRLKRLVGGHASIQSVHDRYLSLARPVFEHTPNLVLLGSSTVERLPIFSFLVRWKDRFLHYNFVCALLNDLFGIQSRGGCQCAGPYAQRLLGLTPAASTQLEDCLLDEKAELLRPGFSRLSLPYALAEFEVLYVLDALRFVAEHAWLFLPHYRFDHKTGECRHKSRATRFPERRWLTHFQLSMDSVSAGQTGRDDATMARELKGHLDAAYEQARTILSQPKKACRQAVNDQAIMLSETSAPLRWFVYPSEAARALSELKPRRLGDPALLTNTPEAALELSSGPVVVVESVSGPVDPSRAGPALNQLWEESEGNHAAETAHDLPKKSGRKKYPKRPANRDAPEPPLYLQSAQLGKMQFEPTQAQAEEGAEPSKKKAKREETFGVGREEEMVDVPVAAHDSSVKIRGEGQDKNKKKGKLPVPPRKMMKQIGEAIADWSMIRDGDRLVVGLSGGKDSLSLLFALLDLQKRAPVKFTLAAATVNPETESYDPSPLIDYMKELGVAYHYLSHPIVDRASKELQGDSLCAYCSRMKRGLLYSCCRENNYNKLVLGQHLDDLAESFIMSVFHNGQIRTMKAHYRIDAGDVHVIRPLCYVREHQTKEFAQTAHLPIINENCPACFEQPKERHRVKKMLAREEALSTDLFQKFKTALIPLMDDAAYPLMSLIRQRVSESNAMKQKRPKKQTKRGKCIALDEDDTPAAASQGGAPAKDGEGSTAALMERMASVLSVLPTPLLRRCVAERESALAASEGGPLPQLSTDESHLTEAEAQSVGQLFRIADTSMCVTGKCEMFN